MTSKNNRAPLLGYIKLCALFHSHRSIQTGVTVRKRQIRAKIGHFFVPRDLEIWRITLKNNRAPLLCYFKLCASFHSHRSIQTGVTVRKRQIRVKIGHFLSHVTLKFDGWPWKNNRAPLLCYFKLCVSFHSHGSFQAGVRVRKPQIRVKISEFLPRVTLKFDVWPWKTIGHLFYAASSCVHDFIAICEFKLELESGNG